MSDKHLSVFPKVLLYVFDVGSDWTNGAFMIQEGGSRFNIACLEDHEQEEMHKFFGYITIGMSWFPAIADLGYSGRAGYSDLIPNGTRSSVIT